MESKLKQNEPTTPALLLSPKQAAAIAGVSLRHWYSMLSAGKIGPPVVKLGGCVRFNRDEVISWINAGCPAARIWKARKQAS